MKNPSNDGFHKIIDSVKSLPALTTLGTKTEFKWWDNEDDGTTTLEKMPDREHHRMFDD